MGRLQKAGKSGTAAAYCTRGQAIRKLQISLKDFRRLCILKGIYPRDPRKKANGKDKTYYHKKDVAFLLHEPLLRKFREMKIFLRQKKRLKMRHEDGLVEALQKRKPVLNLDHLVKERYPSFVDALRDMDDALTLVHLFAHLPSGLTKYHKSSTSDECLEIAREFQSLVAHEHWLRKVFVSVKGIYYQAEVQGEFVTWTVPHKFAQQCPTDVDYRVMLTFLDFYLTLFRFVNFKLYHDSELAYPPMTVPESVAKGRMVSAVVINKIQKSEDEKIDAEFIESVAEADDSTSRTPFKDLIFLLSRETPCDSLEFVILSGGGRVYHEDDYTDELAEVITHQVVDRPALRSPTLPTREYIQPQWVFDSFNAGALLPIHPYGVGEKLPPHLSPFVDDAAEGYIPTQRKVIEAWTQNKSILEAIEECEDDDSDVEITNVKTDAVSVHKEPAPMTEAEEEKELAKIMMTNKKKRLYSKMQYGINEKKKKVAVLETKRKNLNKKSKK